MEQTDELLTVDDVSRILKVTVPTVYAWRYSGRIPYIKINGAVRFKRCDLDRMIQEGARKKKNG